MVAEALVDIFCRTGVPKEMLTDMGSQFTSELMAEVSRLLPMRQLTTTPYHPMCNGLVERFNGTLKQILRRYVPNIRQTGTRTFQRHCLRTVMVHKRVWDSHRSSWSMGMK